MATRSLSCWGFGPLVFVPLEDEEEDDEEEEEEEEEDDEEEEEEEDDLEAEGAPPAPCDPAVDCPMEGIGVERVSWLDKWKIEKIVIVVGMW